MHKRLKGLVLLIFGLMVSLFVLSACNLSSAPQEPITQATATSLTQSAQIEVTQREGGVTVFPTLTAIPFSTQPFVFVPPNPPRPTNTPAPISIVIVSPLQGNVVAGTVQVVGSASHPNFLQYRLEYGPQPNLNNQWFSITGIVQTPVLGGPLGLWSTQSIADGYYQLRLRVFLQDGTQQTTQVGNILVQNGQPTPVPTNTTVPQPIASFTQDLTQGAVPLVVSFKNKSQGQISSLSWSFGDGGSSSLSNPVYTYTKAGQYTVTLTVKGPGGTSNVSRQITVKSPDAPIANFAPNLNSGEAPLNVAFTNQTTGQVNSYEWDFGDDSTSTETNPTHIFNDVGTFNVILKATGPGGTSTMIQQITVENPSIPAPVADFAPSIAPAETGQSITFNNTSTGNITSYLWDFNGDGFTDNTDVSPTHTYDKAGVYNVRLIVIGPGGQSTALKEILIISPPQAPVAAFSVSPTDGIAPLAVQFTNSTTGDVTSYEWDFNGDGVVDSTDASPAYTYQDAGTYNPVLTATGPGGLTTASQTISVQAPPQPPTASFIADPQTGQAPLTVVFTNQSEGTELTYAWDFNGDGVADDTTENPTRIFDTAGDYTVSLQVTDPLGQSSTDTQTITVTEVVVIPPPVTAFTFSPETGQAPLTVTFTNQSTGDISGYQWDFNGDSVTDSTDASPTFVFQTAGTYTVTLIATGAGGSSEVSQDISVAEPLVAPQANFSANPTTGPAPLTVLFADASTGQVDTWAWDFNGDGAVDATGAGPHTFSFDAPHTYNATLTVGNAAGSTNFTVPIVVENVLAPPTANFTMDVTSGDAPLTVTFTDASTGQVDKWSWDFDGNGTEDAVGAGPQIITYDTTGTYTIILTASNSAGSTQWLGQVTVTDALAPPIANFTADVTSGTAPLTVTFTDASTGQVDNWSWDFNADGVEDAIGQGPHVVPYDVAGMYTAVLTASNSAGSTQSQVQITVTDALAPPTANFTADVTSGTAPLTVTFTDASTGQVDNWSWDFNADGVEDAIGQGPHVVPYDVAGTYTAILTASNSAGSTQWQVQITVTDALAPPTANFTADVTSGTAPLTVTFTDASTGQVDNWSWDFNADGVEDAIGQGPHVVPYDVAGTYTAILTASNSAGSTQWQVQVTVTDALAPPTANFTADVTSGTAPLTVTFTDASTGQVDNWSWDFNADGVEDTIGQGPHVVPYDVAGTYTAILTASNSAGSTQSQVQITVTDALAPPTANFTADVTSGTAPLTVTFTDASTGQVDNWSWDFNADGVEDAIGQGPHVVPYDVAGTYTAVLTASNSAGSTQSQVQITVTDALAPPTANFTADVTSGTAPLTVTFTDASTGQVDNWSWDFNADGVEDAIGQGPHVVPYDVAGMYTAVLTASNSAGSTQSQVQITVTDALAPPTANFTADVTSGTAPLTVTFTDASTGQVDNWSWDFNADGVEDAIGQGPHVVPYDVAGTYTAVLTASNSAGSTQSQVQIAVTDAPLPSINGNVAFVTDRDGNNEIYVVNDDGSELTNVTNHGANDRQPVWSPDGTQIAFVSNREGDNDIFILNIDDLSVVQLTFNQANERQPAWSPDGTQIAFVSDELGTNDIFVVDVSNLGITQLIVSDQFSETDPVWSPDGSQMLFTSDEAGNNNTDIYLVNLSDIGNHIPFVVDPAYNNSQAAWSVDNVIAFVSDQDGDNNIYIINSDLSGLTALTTNTTSETLPAWSPDGTRILYTSDADSNGDPADNNIYFMNSDGTGQQLFTTDSTNEVNAVQR